MKMYRRILAALLFIGAASLAAAAELPVIALARDYLGPDAALVAVQSICYEGVLIPEEGAAEVPIEILFQKPCQQRIVVKSETTVETTALNDYEGWHRTQSAQEPDKQKLTLLTIDQLRSLRANTAENLWFYTGPSHQGGTIEDFGEVSVRGATCRKLAFRYTPSVVFIRYIDTTTGRLVQSETEKGDWITEEGEIVAGGVRFPKRIVRHSKKPDGSPRVITILFNKITVNEPVEASAFTMPPALFR